MGLKRLPPRPPTLPQAPRRHARPDATAIHLRHVGVIDRTTRLAAASGLVVLLVLLLRCAAIHVDGRPS
jgi:hypothetical protein